MNTKRALAATIVISIGAYAGATTITDAAQSRRPRLERLETRVRNLETYIDQHDSLLETRIMQLEKCVTVLRMDDATAAADAYCP